MFKSTLMVVSENDWIEEKGQTVTKYDINHTSLMLSFTQD